MNIPEGLVKLVPSTRRSSANDRRLDGSLVVCLVRLAAGFSGRFPCSCLAYGLLAIVLLGGAAGCSPTSDPAASALRTAGASGAQLEWEQNRLQLEQMDGRQIAELRDSRKRFEEMPAEVQNQLRKLHADLVVHPDREALLAVMNRYVEWTRTLDERTQAGLPDKSTDERFEEVCRLRTQPGRTAAVLSLADSQQFEAWFRNLADRRSEDVNRILAGLEKDRGIAVPFSELGTSESRLRLLFLVAANKAGEIVTDAEVRDLVGRLSAEGQGLLNQPERNRLVRYLVVSPGSDKDLRRFYVEGLTVSQRESLMSMSEDERKRNLRRLFIQSRLRGDSRQDTGPGT